ncbi:MAG: endonuclease NucS [Candidatus Nanohaloarchaea archaeon]|nr:endonuclease NucS [Candidatus Nanohaloarchaea archaeon]
MEHLLTDPSMDEARELMEEYLSRPYVTQITGLCGVNYQGRAKSKLDRGERIVIIKQDNALLVHGPENYQPKNWQPETDRFDLELEDDTLLLRSTRTDPREVVDIRFETIEALYITSLVDRSELKVKGHEVDIHESIEDDPEIVEEGLTVVEREKKTKAGLIDVFARDTEDSLVVIEVKRNPDHNSVLQLNRYVDEIEDEFPGRTIRGILVAPKASENVIDYLEERDLEFVEVSMDEVIQDYDDFRESQSNLEQFSADYST